MIYSVFAQDENTITVTATKSITANVKDGENAQNAPVIKQIPSYAKTVVEFDMMIPSLKADNVTKNPILHGRGNLLELGHQSLLKLKDGKTMLCAYH